MLVQHPFVPAELLGVVGRSAEDLAPPGGDVHPVLFVDATGKEGREQLVLLDAVVEGVDQTVEGLASPGPFEQRGIVGHRCNVPPPPRRSARYLQDSRRRTHQKQNPASTRARPMKIAVSYIWKGQ